MKQMGVFLVSIVMTSGIQAAEPTYRTFSDTEGREIRARILDFDEADGQVKIERDNRRKVTVPITLFSDEDQAYINSWGQISAFTSESTFRISATGHTEENTKASKELQQKYHAIDFWVNETCYQIQLNNRSTSPLSNLEAEYCIFYTQNSSGREIEGVFFGTLEIADIGPNSEKTLKTDAVLTYKSRVQGGYVYANGSSTHQAGRVEGIWIKVYMKSNGKKLVREFSIPEDLPEDKAWHKESVVAGIN